MLSVVIPCHNRQGLIGPTIASLAGFQGYPLEIIVVDDRSTDDSAAAARQAIRELPSVATSSAVIEGEGKGACAARNKGLAAASGDWVLFMDSDDPCEPGGLQNICALLAKDPTTDIAYGWVWEVDEAGKRVRKNGSSLEECVNRIFDHHWHTSGAVYRRDLLQRSGGLDSALTLADDWEFGARARMRARNISYCDTCVGYYVHHQGTRLIARSFDKRKAKSVILAALKIRSVARALDLLDIDLRRRIWRRLLVQSNELFLHGRVPPAKRVLACCATQAEDKLVALLAVALLLVPSKAFQSFIYSRLRAKGLRA